MMLCVQTSPAINDCAEHPIIKPQKWNAKSNRRSSRTWGLAENSFTLKLNFQLLQHFRGQAGPDQHVRQLDVLYKLYVSEATKHCVLGLSQDYPDHNSLIGAQQIKALSDWLSKRSYLYKPASDSARGSFLFIVFFDWLSADQIDIVFQVWDRKSQLEPGTQCCVIYRYKYTM